jgi:hypothetical protein
MVRPDSSAACSRIARMRRAWVSRWGASPSIHGPEPVVPWRRSWHEGTTACATGHATGDRQQTQTWTKRHRLEWQSLQLRGTFDSRNAKWGGWGSNPRPTDCEFSWPERCANPQTCRSPASARGRILSCCGRLSEEVMTTFAHTLPGICRSNGAGWPAPRGPVEQGCRPRAASDHWRRLKRHRCSGR